MIYQAHLEKSKMCTASKPTNDFEAHRFWSKLIIDGELILIEPCARRQSSFYKAHRPWWSKITIRFHKWNHLEQSHVHAHDQVMMKQAHDRMWTHFIGAMKFMKHKDSDDEATSWTVLMNGTSLVQSHVQAHDLIYHQTHLVQSHVHGFELTNDFEAHRAMIVNKL